jgi:PhnB protein
MNAYDALRHHDRPVEPDPRFAARLRAEITTALSPTIDLAERTPTMNTPSTTNTIANLEPDGRGLVPYITVHDAAAAIDWYREVFAAVELVRYVGEDGRVGHCQLLLSGSMMMIADEFPDFGAVSPRTVGGSPIRLNLNVDDVDAVWELALAKGADGQRAPEDQAYGERSCAFADPFGHLWMVQTTVSHPSNEQIQEAMGDAFTIIEPEGTAD